jgi:hypothetical protein
MDSFQFWLYVIIGVVYLISRMRKKSAGQPEERPEVEQESRSGRNTPQTKSAPQKTLTFEELLREITESKQPKEQPVVDYDDNLEEEEKDLEEVDYDYRKDNKVYETYEEAKKQAFFRPSLEETMKVEDTVVSFGKFKEFERAAGVNLAAEYLKDFGDLGSIRKAVVMSEILKRKF